MTTENRLTLNAEQATDVAHELFEELRRAAWAKASDDPDDYDLMCAVQDMTPYDALTALRDANLPSRLTGPVAAALALLAPDTYAPRADHTIEQHDGEHQAQDQEDGDTAPKTTSESGESETAETIATRALAAWGITPHADDEPLIGGTRNTWLVIGYDQLRPGFPHMLDDPYIVLYLYREEPEEITVTRAPANGDHWHVIVGDVNGAERELMTRPADQLPDCVQAIADWVTNPLPTAGSVLLAALAEHGITAHTDAVGLSYAIPLYPNIPALDIYNRAHLSVADRTPSIEHDPAAHTGWTVIQHDDNGHPLGDPLYIAGSGEPVDCTADSQAAATFITDWLTAPQH
ncbi:hypothetical protein ABZ864_47625 [Streptomyces sp. NPDC047082]|uniref:hypothetical protein n=1 Tax=Streptomyces sp. NPDC047082 TaxID=3155259 RepID=UPI0033F1F838